MAVSLDPTDMKIVSTLAEYRLLTTGQLATLLDLTGRTARRRVRDLVNQNFVEAKDNDTGPVRGRPENLLSLTSRAVEALKANRALGGNIPDERVTRKAIRCVAHQLLLNSFRIRFHEMEAAHPAFAVRFLSSNSPFALSEGGGQPLIYDRAEAGDAGFVPDAVFSISHRGLGRALLFFLEVDMGTETVGSPTTDGVLRRKITTYQAYFRAGGYRRYEQIFGAKLKGFRLLFLTRGPKQLQSLCRLVAAMPPSDFIWLTDQGQMDSDGVAATIWVRAGRIKAPRQSILGSQMPAPQDGQVPQEPETLQETSQSPAAPK